jgi:hypothetical protein
MVSAMRPSVRSMAESELRSAELEGGGSAEPVLPAGAEVEIEVQADSLAFQMAFGPATWRRPQTAPEPSTLFEGIVPTLDTPQTTRDSAANVDAPSEASPRESHITSASLADDAESAHDTDTHSESTSVSGADDCEPVEEADVLSVSVRFDSHMSTERRLSSRWV